MEENKEEINLENIHLPDVHESDFKGYDRFIDMIERLKEQEDNS